MKLLPIKFFGMMATTLAIASIAQAENDSKTIVNKPTENKPIVQHPVQTNDQQKLQELIKETKDPNKLQRLLTEYFKNKNTNANKNANNSNTKTESLDLSSQAPIPPTPSTTTVAPTTAASPVTTTSAPAPAPASTTPTAATAPAATPTLAPTPAPAAVTTAAPATTQTESSTTTATTASSSTSTTPTTANAPTTSAPTSSAPTAAPAPTTAAPVATPPTSSVTEKIVPTLVPGDKPKTELSYKGHYQFRTESAKNANGIKYTDINDSTSSRLRAYFTFAPNKNLKLNLTPQATKGFGANDWFIKSDGTTEKKETSGGTTHTDLSFYEANIDYNIVDNFSMKLGRQEMSYGEHLVIGALPWVNTARSFDAAKFKFKYDLGWTDLFRSRIGDNYTATNTTDDTNFDGIYSSFNFNDYVKPLDLYLLQKRNRLVDTTVNMFGFRILGSVDQFFYRTENGFQNAADSNQFNLETGYKFGGNFSASLEYATAGSGYDQLYPTAHKFLGYADVLKRNNINQLALYLNGKFTNWLSGTLDIHSFKRNKDDKPVSNLTTSLGSTGDSKDVGNEVDLLLTASSSDGVKVQLGHCVFQPGEYMKDNGKDKTTTFSYLQLNAEF